MIQMNQKLIDANELWKRFDEAGLFLERRDRHIAQSVVEEMPSVAAVPLEAYNELCEMFMDYILSGVPNPAPYCENACDECLNAYGWCSNGESEACKGFVPMGRSTYNATD